MHIPSSAFMTCATAPAPLNTLFPDLDSTKIHFGNLETYLDLVLALFSISPEGS
jgi:hypothetical protein